jgi:5-methylcytosine-specific restriction enzyme subunit McrC
MTKLIELLEYQESIKLNDKEIIKVENINKLYNKKIFEISYKNKTIKPKQHIGIINLGTKIIEIYPKIFTQKEKFEEIQENEKVKLKRNLLFMLSKTKKLNIETKEISKLSKEKSLFEIFIRLYAENLLKLLNFDLPKSYEKKEENLNYLKGKLLIGKNIRNNLVNKTKFYCKYDNFSENILLNQIFKATTKKLLQLTKSKENYKLLLEIDLILKEVDLKSLTLKDFNKNSFNRLNNQFEDIFNLAKLLYFGKGINFFSKNEETYSLLFDMNRLFEEFIYESLKFKIKKEEKFQNLIIGYEKPREYLMKRTSKKLFQLKPDIVIYEEKEGKLFKEIIDIKYKIINNLDDLSRNDFYQMFVYSQIYDCKEIILLYPEMNYFNNENFKFNINFKEEYFLKIKFIKLIGKDFLKKEDYSSFMNELGKLLLEKI